MADLRIGRILHHSEVVDPIGSIPSSLLTLMSCFDNGLWLLPSGDEC